MSDLELNILSDVEKPSIGEEDEKAEAKQSTIGAAMNLANSTMGAGILGLPFVFKEGGMILAFFMLLLAAFLADVSLRMLLEAFELSGRKATYEEIGEHCFGRMGKVRDKEGERRRRTDLFRRWCRWARCLSTSEPSWPIM